MSNLMNTTRTKSDVLQDIENQVNLSGTFDTISDLMEKYKPLARPTFSEMNTTIGERF
jgi:hypothetical protein